MRTKTSLRTELLVNLAFLAAVALILGVTTVSLVAGLAPDRELLFTLTVIALDVMVFILFGRYLISRLVLRPLDRLVAVTEAVAAGDFAARASGAETQEFDVLAERLNRMTDYLLDVQGQLVRSEKFATVGRFAAGIAHEVGNPLGAVGTYVEVLRRRNVDPELVGGAVRELDRIDRIVRGLLDYARPHEEGFAPIDPGAVLHAAHGLLAAQGSLRACHISLEISEGVPQIRGRAHQLEQVFVNLILNAADAAPGGQIVLGARAWEYDPGRSEPRRVGDAPADVFPRPASRRPGRADFAIGEPGVLLYVADSGRGIAPEDRSKVFEPFYTTKEPTRGTGLGLAIVARTVDEMGGVVWVDTAREGGAAFKMFFPKAGGGQTGRDMP
jgi:hypothetical protein